MDIKIKNNIEARVEEVLDEIIAIRRDFHSHPELSQQELRTAAKISEYLTAWEIPHQTGVAGHGIVGLIQGTYPASQSETNVQYRSEGGGAAAASRSEDGNSAAASRSEDGGAAAASQPEAAIRPVVAIRADIDALPIQEKNDVPYRSQNPGIMHACGHDIHTAVLLGTAKILKEMQDLLPGTVKLFFQPAEETVGGARPMIQAGCLENPRVDAVIGLHVEPDIPVGALEFRRGSMNAASNEFTITVTGSSSHGARPHNGTDAILTASQIVCALQSIASRNVSPTDAVVVTVGQFHSGTASNILAGETVMKGIIRTLNPAARKLAVRRVKEIAESTAAAFGATAKVDFIESYPALINDDTIEGILERTAASHFSQNQIFFRTEPSMGAEDFSYFCDAVKSAYFNIGTKTSPDSPTISLHSECFCPDEACIRTGMVMEICGALSILQELTNAKDRELKNTKAGELQP